MLEKFSNIFRIPDLRNRLLFTLPDSQYAVDNLSRKLVSILTNSTGLESISYLGERGQNRRGYEHIRPGSNKFTQL